MIGNKLNPMSKQRVTTLVYGRATKVALWFKIGWFMSFLYNFSFWRSLLNVCFTFERLGHFGQAVSRCNVRRGLALLTSGCFLSHDVHLYCLLHADSDYQATQEPAQRRFLHGRSVLFLEVVVCREGATLPSRPRPRSQPARPARLRWVPVRKGSEEEQKRVSPRALVRGQ